MTGLTPGEAGCCVMVESASSLASRNANSLAKVERVELEMEQQSVLKDEAVNGQAMKNALTKLLADYSASSPLISTLVCDLNGENWKAMQLANARTANAALSDSSPLIIPAGSLGDVGASVGAVCLCLATQVFARNYNSLKTVLVTTSSEYGHVDVARLVHS